MGCGEVTARLCRGFQSSVAVELGPVVAGEGMHRLRLLAQQENRAAIHGGHGSGRELAEHEISGFPLDQTQHTVPARVGAEDGVRFPIPDPASGVDDRGARGDGPFPGEPAPAVVVAIALPARLGVATQVRVQCAARPFVGPDMPVDRLMADPEPALLAEPPGDLLRAPELTKLGIDLGPVGRGEALIAPGVGAAGSGIGIGELNAVAAIVVGGIAADLAIERTAVAAEQPGDRGHGDMVLAEPRQDVSFRSGDLGVHR